MCMLVSGEQRALQLAYQSPLRHVPHTPDQHQLLPANRASYSEKSLLGVCLQPGHLFVERLAPKVLESRSNLVQVCNGGD